LGKFLTSFLLFGQFLKTHHQYLMLNLSLHAHFNVITLDLFFSKTHCREYARTTNHADFKSNTGIQNNLLLAAALMLQLHACYSA
jgi:hypothetical protein